uniref:Myb/SANT-like domain-containing protein n=1 Tax=Ananas comosus var. bracteatus TaxID=296719 RepID=A0A6V7QMF6_ANACO|nr:unnamed protein product [Ananas comosus var. bracteatus]
MSSGNDPKIKSRAKWTEMQKMYLVTLLKEHNNPRFQQQLKRAFRLLKSLTKLSGFGWDATTNMVSAPQNVWEPILESNKEARKWYNKSFPHFDTLFEIYVGKYAKGKRARGSNSGIEVLPTDSPISQMDLPSQPTSPNPSIPALGDSTRRFDCENESEEEYTDLANPPMSQVSPPTNQTQSQPLRPSIPPSEHEECREKKKLKVKNNPISRFGAEFLELKKQSDERYLALKEEEHCLWQQKHENADAFSISNKEERMKATQIFTSKDNREIFLSIEESDREIWLKTNGFI